MGHGAEADVDGRREIRGIHRHAGKHRPLSGLVAVEGGEVVPDTANAQVDFRVGCRATCRGAAGGTVRHVVGAVVGLRTVDGFDGVLGFEREGADLDVGGTRGEAGANHQACLGGVLLVGVADEEAHNLHLDIEVPSALFLHVGEGVDAVPGVPTAGDDRERSVGVGGLGAGDGIVDVDEGEVGAGGQGAGDGEGHQGCCISGRWFHERTYWLEHGNHPPWEDAMTRLASVRRGHAPQPSVPAGLDP